MLAAIILALERGASRVISSAEAASVTDWLLGTSLLWALLCVYRLTMHPLSRYKGSKIAACTSLWFFYWTIRGRLSEECDRLYQRYGTNALRIGPNQVVFRSADSLKEIAGRHDVYKGPYTTKIFGFHSTNVSNIKDPVEHRRKRKLMNPGFAATTLVKQEPTLIVPLVDKLATQVEKTQGREFDITTYLDSVTTDIIGKLSFGADFSMLDDPEHHPFLHVLQDAFRVSTIAQGLPGLYNLIDFLASLSRGLFMPRSCLEVARFAKKHLHERAERDEDIADGDRHDIMSVIVDVEDGEERMSKEEMLGEAIVLVSAGGDTVATALTMTMWNLSQHPAIMAQLQSRLRQAFTSKDSLSSKAVSSAVPLLDAVINESMRLTPVLSGPIWRRSDVDVMIDGQTLPAGTDFGVHRSALFQNEQCFHDPKTFKPERWMQKLGDNFDAAKPFSIGPHTCPGRFLAMVEMRLILSKLLWTFDWEFVTKTYNNPDFSIVYRGAFMVRARKIEL